jgi:DNA-binding GntR family transcriptional regulator
MMQGTFAQVEWTSLREAVGRALCAAHNDHTVNLVSGLHAHTRLFRLATLRERGELESVAPERRAIIDTVVSRNPEAVERLMREHIGQTRGRWAAPTRQRAD